MLKTYTQLLNQYTNVTQDTTTANTTQGTLRINSSVRAICNLQGGKLRFLESTKDMATVANQSGYQVPNGFRKLIRIVTFSGSTGLPTDTMYTPEMVFDPETWTRVLQYRLGTTDVPMFTYVENQKYYIQPTPATSGNLITVRGRLQVNDMTIADYTTGTVTSIANAGTAVVGSGTTWTKDMIGRSIQFTQTTAANGGDGYWYEIGGWTDATHITLLKPYEGTSISGATAAYTIGQCSVIPEAYTPAIIYRSAALYWQDNDDLSKARMYWLMYDGGNELGENKEYGGLIGQMLANEGETEEGGYVPPTGSTQNLPGAPYYQPFQNASGFS